MVVITTIVTMNIYVCMPSTIALSTDLILWNMWKSLVTFSCLMKIAIVSQICKSRLELIPNSTRCIENCVREIDAMTRCEVNVLYYLYLGIDGKIFCLCDVKFILRSSTFTANLQSKHPHHLTPPITLKQNVGSQWNG